MGPRAGLNTVAMRKSSCPCQEMKPGHIDHSSITVLSYAGSCSKIVAIFTV